MSAAALSLARQSEHLAKVSRTFALTIPLLPLPLADYVSHAYLMCRIADTIEDDPIAPAQAKFCWLRDYGAYALQGFEDELRCLDLHHRAVPLCSGAHRSEQDLLADLPEVVARLQTFPQTQRRLIGRCVAIMSFGMAHFCGQNELKNRRELDEYCYFVAGVVGEFLAESFALSYPEASRSRLLELSVSFAEGLQLTNILKDRSLDAVRQVSYLPGEGESSETETISSYVSLCAGHLEDALDFVCALPVGAEGVRAFCLINVLMAAATLRNIRRQPQKGQGNLKISRRTVVWLMKAGKLGASRNLLCRLLYRLSAGELNPQRRSPAALRSAVSWWERESPEIILEDS